MGWYYVCVSCESGLAVYMAGPGICILCLADTLVVPSVQSCFTQCSILLHRVFNPVAPYGYLRPNVCLFMAYIANPTCLNITHFYDEPRQPSTGFTWPAYPKQR